MVAKLSGGGGRIAAKVTGWKDRNNDLCPITTQPPPVLLTLKPNGALWGHLGARVQVLRHGVVKVVVKIPPQVWAHYLYVPLGPISARGYSTGMPIRDGA